jgi:DNA-binding NtrC family response regulator
MFLKQEGNNTYKMRKKESATVLIVDDDQILLNIVAEQISLFGYKPILASNAEEALQIAPKQTQIDLLLTDIMMPNMNGVDLAKQFITLYPETKVLFMSGYICPSMAHYGIKDSEHAFIQKPFTPQTLITKMRNVLEGPSIDLPTNNSDS